MFSLIWHVYGVLGFFTLNFKIEYLHWTSSEAVPELAADGNVTINEMFQKLELCVQLELV